MSSATSEQQIESEGSSKNRFEAPAMKTNKIDNSRDNSRMIATDATRTFITNNLKPLLNVSDSTVEKFFQDVGNLVKLKKQLKKKMAAVMFEQMMKNKKMFEEDGKYYIGKSEAVSKKEMLDHLEKIIDDELLEVEINYLREILKTMKNEEKLNNINNNINRLQNVNIEAQKEIIKLSAELKNVNKELLDNIYKQDRTISSIRSEQIANEQADVLNLQLDQSINVNKLELMNRKSKAEQTEIQNKHNKEIENMQRKVNDLIKAQNNSINKAHKHAREAAATQLDATQTAAAAQLAATQAAAVAQLDATQAVADSQVEGFKGAFKGLNNINNNLIKGSQNTIEGLKTINNNFVSGFDDIHEDFKDLGSSFNNGFDNLTRVTDRISNEIAISTATTSSKIDELTASIQGIQSELIKEVSLQNSSSSSTSGYTSSHAASSTSRYTPHHAASTHDPFNTHSKPSIPPHNYRPPSVVRPLGQIFQPQVKSRQVKPPPFGRRHSGLINSGLIMDPHGNWKQPSMQPKFIRDPLGIYHQNPLYDSDDY